MKTIYVTLLACCFAAAATAQTGTFPPSTGSGSAAIACVGTPGNTAGASGTFCKTPAGAVYACNTTAPTPCAVAGDWGLVGPGAGGPPTGTAGGKLSGSYPNPGVNLASGDIPSNAANTTGNAATATTAGTIPCASAPTTFPVALYGQTCFVGTTGVYYSCINVAGCPGGADPADWTLQPAIGVSFTQIGAEAQPITVQAEIQSRPITPQQFNAQGNVRTVTGSISGSTITLTAGSFSVADSGAVITVPLAGFGYVSSAVEFVWQLNTAYSLGVTILDSAGHVQQVTTAGTSGATRPTFNDVGGTTADGSTLVWTDEGAGPITGTVGQNCAVTFNGGGTGATGFIVLTGTNTVAPVIAGQTVPILGVVAGTGYTSGPTVATLSNGIAGKGGAATCSGTIPIVGQQTYSTLFTAISSVTDSTHAVVAKAATSAVTGATISIGADDTAAIAAACAQAVSLHKGLYIPQGTYFTDTVSCLNTYGVQIFGDGPYGSVLKSSKGNDVIATVLTTAIVQNATIRDLGIDGSSAAANRGIYFSNNTSVGMYRINISNVYVQNVGAQVVYLPSSFNISISQLTGNSLNGDGIDIFGGNTVTIQDSYIYTVGANHAAYRLHTANFVCISCNGINGNAANLAYNWGVFGENVAEDGENNAAEVSLINSNIEDFTSIGVRLKYGARVSLIGSILLAYSTSTTQGFLIDLAGAGAGIQIDGGSALITFGTWLSGHAIHSAGACGFIMSYVQTFTGESGSPMCYDNATATPYTIPIASSGIQAAGVSALAFNELSSPDAYFQNLSSYGATAPTITSGFGTSPAIAGSDSAGKVTVGTGGSATTGVVTFGVAFKRTTVNCFVRDKTTASFTPLMTWVETNSTLTISTSTAWTAGDVLAWVCVGY